MSNLAESPLIWLLLTLGAYLGALYLYKRCNYNPLTLPVLSSVCAVVALLLITGTSYETYFSGAAFLHFLIGPATVALAIPLYKQLPQLIALWRPLGISITIGSLTGLLSALVISKASGASTETIISLLPKSTTMPIATALAEYFGGQPSLTAISVAFTGVLGSILALPLFNLLRLNDPIVRGVATGVAAHAIGTARLFQVNEAMGAFAALAMSLTGILTALLMPLIMPLV